MLGKFLNSISKKYNDICDKIDKNLENNFSEENRFDEFNIHSMKKVNIRKIPPSVFVLMLLMLLFSMIIIFILFYTL